jgi:hypothetical protein
VEGGGGDDLAQVVGLEGDAVDAFGDEGGVGALLDELEFFGGLGVEVVAPHFAEAAEAGAFAVGEADMVGGEAVGGVVSGGAGLALGGSGASGSLGVGLVGS